MEDVKASVPEPPPVDGDIEVTPKLIEWIRGLDAPPEMKDGMTRLVLARSEFGFKKYKKRLMTKNGRNQKEDAKQELGDFLQYVFACILEERIDDEVGTMLLQSVSICGSLYCEWMRMRKDVIKRDSLSKFKKEEEK